MPPYRVPVRVHVLGTTRVSGADPTGEAPAREVGARKPRAVLAALALTPGRPVTLDAVTDLVWDGSPPRAARAALHAYVSGLRAALGGGDRDRAGSLIRTTDHGYLLAVAAEDVDAHAFAQQVDGCVRTLGPVLARVAGGAAGRTAPLPGRDEVGAAVERLETAEGWWAGSPYADLPDHPDVTAERTGLLRRRAAGQHARAAALLALGDHAAALSWTAGETLAQPLSEPVWALHALALHRSGRQVEALQTVRTLRRALVEELGLDPTTEVQELEQALLRQDETLREPLLPPPEVDLTVPVATRATLLDATPATWPVGTPSESRTVGRGDLSPRRLLGRDGERATLADLLAAASDGRTAVGVVVGEPGIGKSALLADLADHARARGVTVAVGRCSQDDGAPPLWPFVQLLRDLGGDVVSPLDLVPAGDAPAFATWERIARAVLEAARSSPVLVVLDDLQWADEATHRALAHLVQHTPDDARLAVVVSRRSHPDPTGTLALAADALARRQRVRLDLTGLDMASATSLVRGVTAAPTDEAAVTRWHLRCGGNPFYLVELARLGDVGADDAVPGGVLDVVRRRLQELPPATQDVLRAAAVAGRSFPAGLVAGACDLDEDSVDEQLAVAAAQGLVHETAVGTWSFAHALTRDAVLRTSSASRSARRHARIAQLLEGPGAGAALLEPDERTAELARHWSLAGPSYAERAWPAARAAADQARSVSAHLEAVRWGQEAVAAQRRSPRSSTTERYDLLLALAEDAARAAVWPEVVAACTEAVAIGRGMADLERVATAAAGLTRYALWAPNEWGEVHQDLVDDLRWALAEVAPGDSPARCRLLLSLAVELYYDVGAGAERDALVEAGLGCARRLDDPWLRWWACRAAWQATWLPARAAEQRGIAQEAVRAAEEAGDPAAQAVACLALAANETELSGPAAWGELAARAGALARRHRLPYVSMAQHLVDANLASLRGDTDAVRQAMAGYLDAERDIAVPGPPTDDGMDLLLAHMWDDALADLGHVMDSTTERDPMLWPILHVALARTGRVDDLAAALARHPLPDLHGLWSSTWTYCWEAEAAAAVGDAVRGARLLPLLRPFAGRMCVAGIAIMQGPVDGYLALAAVAAGEREEASRHADRAAQLAKDWDFPRYEVWLRERRTALGF